MNVTDQQYPRKLHFGLLLLFSFVLFNLGYIVDQTIRWTDHYNGFANGMLHVMMFGPVWCIYILPWSLIIFALYRWRKWRQLRSLLILAPAVLALLAVIGSLVMFPQRPQNRFKRFANTELPKDIQNLHFHFTGGGIVDYSDTYYFQTTPGEVDSLIQNMGLELDTAYGFDGHFYTSIEKIPGWPDFSTWDGAKQYGGHDAEQHWFYRLITNSSRTQVYMLICCT
jgi:hypothetical protein